MVAPSVIMKASLVGKFVKLDDNLEENFKKVTIVQTRRSFYKVLNIEHTSKDFHTHICHLLYVIDSY